MENKWKYTTLDAFIKLSKKVTYPLAIRWMGNKMFYRIAEIRKAEDFWNLEIEKLNNDE